MESRIAWITRIPRILLCVAAKRHFAILVRLWLTLGVLICIHAQRN